MGTSRVVTFVALAGAVASLPLAASRAEAQDTAEDPASPSEIIVTANRRAERLQDVPIAVNVLSSQTLTTSGVSDAQYLSGLVPGLSVTKTNNSSYYLRGIGTSSLALNSEQSVASYIDGVYVYSTFGSMSLANLERVEVLRGPQGTLFGRNTTGGVIQAVTRDPLARPSFEASLTYGNYETLAGSFYGNTHLSDTIGVSLSVDFRDQGKGYGYNSTRNEDAFFRNDVNVRGKIAIEPSDRTKITGLLQYRHTRDSGLNYIPIAGTRGLDGVDGSTYGQFEVRGNAPGLMRLDDYLGYLRVEQELGDDLTLSSITAYHKVRPYTAFDQDATPLDVVTGIQDLEFHNYSQELQLGSRQSGPFTWVVGAFLFRANASYDPLSITGAAAGAVGLVRYFREQKTKSLAGFAQVSYKLSKGTNFTGGLRYTDEKQTIPGGLVTLLGRDPNAVSRPFLPDSQDSSGWTGRLAVDQKFGRSIMGYVSWNRGLKSGGFPLIAVNNVRGYAPEKLDAYEAGLKMEFLGGRVRINPAVFLYKFKNIQVSVLSLGTSVVENAARATISGFDLDASIKISRDFELWGAFEYLHSRYDSYDNAVFYMPATAPRGGGVAVPGQDASGNALSYAPATSGTLGAAYTASVGNGELRIDGSVRYMGEQFVGPSNLYETPAYALVNVGIAWTSNGGRLGVRVWADNIFDDDYSTQLIEGSPGILRIPGAPRTFGVTLSTKM